MLFDYTADNPRALRKYCKQTEVLNIYDIARRIKSNIYDHVNIGFEVFLTMARRYNVPINTLLTTNLWEINHESYLKSVGVERNMLANSEAEFASSIRLFTKFRAYDGNPIMTRKYIFGKKKQLKHDNELVRVSRTILQFKETKDMSKSKDIISNKNI